MESLFIDVNWAAVVVGAIAAYLLGWLWYSPKVFGTQWAVGVGVTLGNGKGAGKAMLTQAFGTFFLSWVIGITAVTDSLALAGLIALTIAVLIKANGFFAQKSVYAIAIESTFVIVMVVAMILTHAIIKI